MPRWDFSVELIEDRPGLIVFRVLGPAAVSTFADEPGGHRFQRIPPNEKRGRVHSSTITVAVLAEPSPTQVVIHDADLEWSTCRGSGPGGQNRNKVNSTAIVKHLPTGLVVRCESERSFHQNKQTALALLRAKLWETVQTANDSARAADRKAQVGAGMRGCKVRTIRMQHGVVVDHRTGQKWELDKYMRGDW